jgi:hypothetical protein
MNRVFLTSAVMVLIGTVANAETFVWSKKSNDQKTFVSGNWTEAANWTLEDGSIPESYPGAGDTVCLPEGMNKNSVREVTLTFSENTAIGTVKGGNCFNIALSVPPNGAITFQKSLSIGNPNDFGGMWRTVQPRTELLFENDETFTPRLAALSTQSRPYINVTNEGARVKIGLLQAKDDANAFYTQGQTVYPGAGAMTKLGLGTLEIEEAAGIEERIYVELGSLALRGKPDSSTSVEKILSRAYMRLDATRRDTMMTYTGDDGRLYVTNWADVNGSGRSAYQDKISNVPTYSSAFPTSITNPFISSVKSSTGLDLMDFGSTSSENIEKLGPLHGILRFKECSQVRELFIVRWRTDSSATYNSMIGHNIQYPLHPGGNYVLFDGNADSGVRGGEIRINGVKAFWGSHPQADLFLHDEGRMHLLNVAPTNAITLNLLGSERYYSGRTGGCRIGEVLIFTQQLTAAERAQVNDYLMKKWFKGYVSCDVGAVTLAKNTSIEVPEGRTARIHRLSLASDTLVKTGGGTLIVDAISPVDAKLDIRGGSVLINPSNIPVSEDAPASAPFVWLDATATETMSFSNDVENAVSYLTNWTDKAGGPIHATPPWGHKLFNSNFPTLKKDVPLQGLSVVDFGDTASYTKDSWMWLSTRGRIAKEGFIVYRNTKRNWGNQFGSSSVEFMRNNYAEHPWMMDPRYAVPRVAVSQWTRDGAVEDPFQNRKNYSFGDTAPFYVISFASPEKVQADLLAKDRLDQLDQGIGAMQIGEFILYDRVLTAEERRNTEAYLIKKWQSKDYPVPTTSYTFKDDSERVFNCDTDSVVTNIIGGVENYVKYGNGKVTLPNINSPFDTVEESIPSFKVYEGELDITYNPIKPLFRFDASVDSFEGIYTSEGKQYFTKWNDASRSHISATAVSIGDWNNKGSLLTETNPVLMEVEMRSGVTRRTADFGIITLSSRAGMHMSQKFNNVREAFAVQQDRSSQNIFCSRETIHYLRGWGTYRQLFQNYDEKTAPVVYGYIAVDGVEQPYTYVPSFTFHIFNCAPTNNTQIDALAVDRGVTGGSLYISEQFAFSNKLSPNCREVITKHLQHKWFEECEKPCFTNEISSVELFGGRLSFAMGEDEFPFDRIFVVSSLTGKGTLSSSESIAVNEIGAINGIMNIENSIALAPDAVVAASFDNEGNLSPITVNGTLTAHGEVSVNIETENVDAIKYGEYKLFEAAELAGKPCNAWRLDKSLLPVHMTAVLRAEEGTVFIDIKSQGTILILR